MAQAFISTYAKSYRWPEVSKRALLRPVDRMAESLPEGDMWIVRKPLGEGTGDTEEDGALAAAEAKVKRMYRDRIRSIYQVEICHDTGDAEAIQRLTPEQLENQLLDDCKRLFKEKTQKVLPPLPSNRRLYGYMRPALMYIPRTVYEEVHGRVAFQILSQGHEIRQASTARRPVCK